MAFLLQHNEMKFGVIMISKSLRGMLLAIYSLLPGGSKDVMSDQHHHELHIKVPQVPLYKGVKPQEYQEITVFVHGTRIFPKFYYQELFYSPEGLNKLSDIDKSFHLHTMAKVLSDADPKRFSIDTFYAFWWKCKLDFDERKQSRERSL